jgi:hypothetical protein
MKKLILALSMASMLVPIVPAAAQYGRHDDRRGYDRRDYDSRGRYRQPHRIGRGDHVWRGNDGRYYCRRSNGTTGLIVGAAAGALLGRAVDGGRDKTLGTILGGVGGGLLGKSVDSGNIKCR